MEITAGLTNVREVAALYRARLINIQKPGDSPGCLLGVGRQPTDSRLSENKGSLPAL